MNYGMIFYVLGMILNFEALFMLPSLVVALIYGEWAGMSILTRCDQLKELSSQPELSAGICQTLKSVSL